MTAMAVPCLLCQRPLDAFHVFHRRALFTKPLRAPEPDAVGEMGIAYCDACRHVSSRFDTPIDVDAASERVYRELYGLYAPTGLSPAQTRWTEFVADWIAGVLPPASRILEVGSHDGYVLHLLKDRGHHCVGVEPSPHGAHARDTYGIEVVGDFFRPGMFPPGSFDAVILRHVVEHVPDPAQFVRDVTDVVAPGGLAYIEVPNSYGSIELPFFPEFHADHLSYFTAASVAQLLERAGLGDVLHLEAAWAYMRFPFLCALARRGAPRAPRPPRWFQDFRLPQLIDVFGERHDVYLANLRRLRDAGTLAVWGTGSIGTQYAIDAGWSLDEVTYVDLSEAAQGLRLSVTGHPVRPPSVLVEHPVDTLLVASGWELDASRQAREVVGPDTRVVVFSDLLEPIDA